MQGPPSQEMHNCDFSSAEAKKECECNLFAPFFAFRFAHCFVLIPQYSELQLQVIVFGFESQGLLVK